MSDRYDVIIIGGGPAGSTAGLVLARAGLKVCVLEKDRHPRFHIGESILPRTTPLLRELGLEEVVRALPHVNKTGAEFGFGNDFKTMRFGFTDGLLPGMRVFNIERSVLDEALAEEAAKAGAGVRQNTAVREIVSLKHDNVIVRTGAGDIHGRLLFDASGQGAVVGRHLHTRDAFDEPELQKVAYFEHFEQVERLHDDENGHPGIIMTDEGWFWLIGINKDVTSVGFVTRPDFAKKLNVAPDRMLQWAIARCPVVRHRMRDAVGSRTNKVVADFSYTCKPYAGDGYFLIGDAACFLDPIFSTGVTLAMMGGKVAAELAIDVLAGKKSPAKAAKEYNRFIPRTTGIFWGLIRGYYRHTFRELFMNGTGPMSVHKAVISILAGQVFPRPVWGLRWRLWLFYVCEWLQNYVPMVPHRPGCSLLAEDEKPIALDQLTAEPAAGGMNADDSSDRVVWPLWDRLCRHATDAPKRLAFVEQTTGRSITYAALVDVIRTAPPSDVTIETLQLGNRIPLVSRLISALRQGRSVMPLDVTVPPAERARLEGIAATLAFDQPHVLLPSSGTTSLPKLVCRSRDGLQGMAEGLAEAIGIEATDRVLAAVPLAHSYGLEHGLLIPLWAGCTTLLCDGLDLPSVAAAWRAGPTIFPAVPSMLELLLRSELDKNDSLRRVYTAGAPLPPSVAETFEKAYGIAVGQVYGMTEIGSVTYRDPARDAADTVGRPTRGVTMKTDANGELLVRSPSMLTRYADDAQPCDADGFFRTGDLAELTEASELRLLGRTKLLIDVGGAKVNPLEVEAALNEHPAVAACVVLPVALSETIRKLRAVVVVRESAAPPTAVELRDFLRHRLARHKVPRLIEFRDTLPLTPAGKIARQLLEAT